MTKEVTVQQFTKLTNALSEWQCEKCTFFNSGEELHCQICYFPKIEIKNLPVQWQWKAAERWITYDLPTTIQIENAYKDNKSEILLNKGWFQQFKDGYKIDLKKNIQINLSSNNPRKIRRIGVDDNKLFKRIKLSDLLDDNSIKNNDKCSMEDSKKDKKKIKIKEKKKKKKKKRRYTFKLIRKKDKKDKDKIDKFLNETESKIESETDKEISIKKNIINIDNNNSKDNPKESDKDKIKDNGKNDNIELPKCIICFDEFKKDDELSKDNYIVQLSTCVNHGFHLKCIAEWVQLKGSCPLCRSKV